MAVRHTELNKPDGYLNDGDTILVRFRLFSDPYAYGWGWAIEDLKINPLIDGIEKPATDPVILYPNPGKGIIRISNYDGLLCGRQPARFEVVNISGMPVSKGVIGDGTDAVIDISGSPSGLYLILLYLDDGVRTYKYSLIR
jgi:hypothetical protein